jgi:hypothetical protein
MEINFGKSPSATYGMDQNSVESRDLPFDFDFSLLFHVGSRRHLIILCKFVYSGNNIKYLRVPDEVIDKVQEDPAKSETRPPILKSKTAKLLY